MLSEQDYINIKWQLEHIPHEIQRKNRANLQQRLKKKIKEHAYATKFDLFEPYPYIPYFINRKINEQTLRTLIHTATTATRFKLDTESVFVRGADNIPALIQLQIILSHKLSLVLIIEMHHLPQEANFFFLLIKVLIRIVFPAEKFLYIFGTKDEFFPFIKFHLFTKEQFDFMQAINLQNGFKRFWCEQHPHQALDSTENDTNLIICQCEICIERNPVNPWSLQDCVAFELEEYLPKIYTNSNFDIGLDPQLYHLIYAQIDILELSPVSSNDDYIISNILSCDKKEEHVINPIKIDKLELKITNSLFKSSAPSIAKEIPSYINNNKKSKIINWRSELSNNETLNQAISTINPTISTLTSSSNRSSNPIQQSLTTRTPTFHQQLTIQHHYYINIMNYSTNDFIYRYS